MLATTATKLFSSLPTKLYLFPSGGALGKARKQWLSLSLYNTYTSTRLTWKRKYYTQQLVCARESSQSARLKAVCLRVGKLVSLLKLLLLLADYHNRQSTGWLAEWIDEPSLIFARIYTKLSGQLFTMFPSSSWVLEAQTLPKSTN